VDKGVARKAKQKPEGEMEETKTAAAMIGGDLVAYFLGLLVEYEWGKHVSLIVFLALYFFSLWVAWMLAVWVTTPRGATSSAS
jgi:hypothetical protein